LILESIDINNDVYYYNKIFLKNKKKKVKKIVGKRIGIYINKNIIRLK
jgi:hypothetical protein